MQGKLNLDHASATPPDSEVLAAFQEEKATFRASPFSGHAEGKRTRNRLVEIRQQMATLTGTSPAQLFFTHSGKQAVQLLMDFLILQHGCTCFFSSVYEHPSVRNALKHRKAQKQIQVYDIPHQSDGSINFCALGKFLAESGRGCLLLSHANYYTGQLLPVKAVAKIARRHGQLFCLDMCQTAGKLEINLRGLPADYAFFSAHKFGGVQGAGMLHAHNAPDRFLAGQARLWQLFVHENHQVAELSAMQQALQKALQNLEARNRHIQALANYLQKQVHQLPGISLNHAAGSKLPGIQMLQANPQMYSSTLPLLLDQEGILAGAFPEKPEFELRRLHSPDTEPVYLRISLSHLSEFSHIDRLIQALKHLALHQV